MPGALQFFSLWMVLIMSSINAQAQHISGEYHLTNVHEMAAGFKFTPEGRFQFFLSYGAVDRNATGTYQVEGDTIKLHSDKEPGKDFDVTTERREGSGYTIRVVHENAILAGNVRCLYFVHGEQYEEYTDQEGVIRINAEVCEKIYVQHALYPDIATLIKDESNVNRYFELKLKPSLEQVSFKGIDLIISESTLTCLPNYFMPMENIRFKRVTGR